MATKAKVKSKILGRLRSRRIRSYNWGDIVSIIGSASVGQKSLMLKAIKNNNPMEVGRLIIKLVKNKSAHEADALADSMLANDALDLKELDDVL